MPRLVRTHSLPVRLSHWLNVPVLAGMTWSGIAISRGDEPYHLRIAGRNLLTLFSQDFYREYNFPEVPTAIGWHLTLAWGFIALSASYATWTLLSGHWRAILPRRRGVRDALAVVRHDLFSNRPARQPDASYNAAQRMAYTLALSLLFGLLVSGVAIFRPTQYSRLVELLGGYRRARAIHFWLTFAVLGFVAIHVLQVSRSGWNVLRGMIIGYEVVPDSEADHAAG